MPAYISPGIYTQDNLTTTGTIINTNELTTKVENLTSYSEYLAENIEKLLNEKEEKKGKQEIFMVFYINIDGMSRQQAEQSICQLNDAYNGDKFESYKVNTVMLPVKNQPTRMEIVNPGLVNGDIIKSFKNLVDTLDDNKYRELIEKL